MNWKHLSSEDALEEALKTSEEKPVLIFKHSTRCIISATALNRLERNWKEEEMEVLQPYFLDLIRYRPLSNMVAAQLGVPHESPQLLLIYQKKCIYETSHTGINYLELKEHLPTMA